MCATKVFFQQWEQIEVLDLANIVDGVIIRSRSRCVNSGGVGEARYLAAEELDVAAFLDACFSVLHVIYVVLWHNNNAPVTRNF